VKKVERRKRRGLAVLGGACVLLAGCATGPDQRDIQEGVLFINPDTKTEQHLADIDACNLARDEENPTGEQAAVVAAGLLLGGLPGLVAIAMMNDEKEATLYNQCMIGKGYEPITLGSRFAGSIKADNGQDDTKELVPAIHAALSDEERKTWKEATLGVDQGPYQSYLDTFPQGVFSVEANLRIAQAELAAPIATEEPPLKFDENGNRIWQVSGEITDGDYKDMVGFCRTGARLRGRLIEKDGRISGLVKDGSGRQYTLGGAIQDNVMRLKHSNGIIWLANYEQSEPRGKIFKIDATATKCDGKFSLT